MTRRHRARGPRRGGLASSPSRRPAHGVIARRTPGVAAKRCATEQGARRGQACLSTPPDGVPRPIARMITDLFVATSGVAPGAVEAFIPGLPPPIQGGRWLPMGTRPWRWGVAAA
jgi:hypothetical protein